MSSRKEDRERLRVERERREAEKAQQERKRMMLGYSAAGVITLAVVAGIVAVIIGGTDGSGGGSGPAAEGFNVGVGVVPDGSKLDDREGTLPESISNASLENSAKAAKCDLRLGLEDEGNTHYQEESKEPDWQTNPPTSGDHYGSAEPGAGALADGPYLNAPPMSRVVHALEHSRVVIQYDPNLPEADQLALKGVYDEDPAGLILMPNPEMPYAVTAAAWTQLLGCDSLAGADTLDAIRNFILEFRGRGPELVPL